MAETQTKKFDWIFFLVVLFLGWLGVDKFIKGSWKLGLLKLVLSVVVVGIVWNIYDLICICRGNYRLSPLK
jgi:hypothetical protein